MSENQSEKTTSNEKQQKNEDEQMQGMSVGEIDPAILVVREKAKVRYSKEELLEIGKSAASKGKPGFLNVAEVSHSILDPEKWNLERKKSDTPTENGSKAGDGPDHRRRSGDPRERLRKENDGIVLSPQRRSFNSGCFVPVSRESNRPNRAHSPLGKADSSHIGARDVQSGTRRIGSGRILRDSWDLGDKSDAVENDFNFGRPSGGQARSADDKRDEKFADRRSFGRDFESNRDKDKDSGRRNPRYSERRRFSENKDDEPEWFSSGPMSQNDTIELRGFEESEKLTQKKKRSPSHAKRTKERAEKKNEAQASIAEESGHKPDGPTGRSTPNSHEELKEDQQEQRLSNDGAEKLENAQKPPQIHGDHSYTFEEILKCESITGLLANGVGGDSDQTTSRFTQWFRKEASDDKQINDSSRRSSIQEDNHIIKDLLKDINESCSVTIGVQPPGDSDSYFAPISPAGNTMGLGSKQSQNVNIMEMLQRGGKQPAQDFGPTLMPIKQPGKILSLDELEAKIRPNATVVGNVQQKGQQKPDEEMTAAFKRLVRLAQAGGHSIPQNGPMHKPQAMSLLEMLNHSQQQDEARMAAAAALNQQHLVGGNVVTAAAAAAAAAAMHQQHQSDLTLKLQQAQLQKQQMDMLNKLINAGAAPAQMRASPLMDIGVQQSRELLSRPEAQAILQGLKRGEITTQHLYQQLANPAVQPRHRDMLLTILKLYGANTPTTGTSYGPSPRVLSPVPPHHVYQQQQLQQQQQLSVSPLPPNAMHQRIPSPRELQVHTQNILQRALIKKKLEEQSENYRKKQEMQRGASPNPVASSVGSGPQQQSIAPSKSISSPTPLAFTPTSVLRKMTADKDEGKENKSLSENVGKSVGRPVIGMRAQTQVGAQQWNQQFPIKQGRPIVKANTNYQPMQSQTPEAFFGQQQQAAASQGTQQRLYGQTVAQQQQRKPIVGQQPNQYSQTSAAQQQQQYVSSQYHQSNPSSFSQQQLTQQQLRAQHQHRPANQQQTNQRDQPQQQGFPHRGQGAAWQQFLNTAAQQQNTQTAAPGVSRNDGALSPSTSDQLARWFSPDLLERARGGELPSTATLARHALSLEEIERQPAPPIHN